MGIVWLFALDGGLNGTGCAGTIVRDGLGGMGRLGEGTGYSNIAVLTQLCSDVLVLFGLNRRGAGDGDKTRTCDLSYQGWCSCWK